MSGKTPSPPHVRISWSPMNLGPEGLINLELPAVICSRPIWNGKRLANEAFLLEHGVVRPLHRRQYFPNEPGWFESEWHAGDSSGVGVAEMLGSRSVCFCVRKPCSTNDQTAPAACDPRLERGPESLSRLLGESHGRPGLLRSRPPRSAVVQSRSVARSQRCRAVSRNCDRSRPEPKGGSRPLACGRSPTLC
jgi:hypothetical protein